MLRSMTAYVNKSFPITDGLLTVEIQSINKKFLEIYTQLDPILSSLELEIKKIVSEKIHRGKINIKISLKLNNLETIKIIPNVGLAKELKNSWEILASELGINSNFNLSLLKGEDNLFFHEDSTELKDDTIKEKIIISFNECVEELVQLKLSEGSHLTKDIHERILFVENSIQKISEDTKNDEFTYRERLLNKVNSILENRIDNEERIIREICIIADKVDVTEELVRMKAHIYQFKRYLSAETLSIGKKLEFLLMEMVRETNTIASKSINLETIHLIVEVKSELEKIKEQLQNID